MILSSLVKRPIRFSSVLNSRHFSTTTQFDEYDLSLINSTNKHLKPWKYQIGQNHCILGLNGSGKTTLLNEVYQLRHQLNHPFTIEYLSFDQHKHFVQKYQLQNVAQVLGGLDSFTKELIVRFGLYPVWSRQISVLSTGEIRKVMLANAVRNRPDLLLLDQPMDGLDKGSREQLLKLLHELVNGFTRLLVDFGSKSEKFSTDIILAVNRIEEVLPEIMTHLIFVEKDKTLQLMDCTLENKEFFLKKLGSNTISRAELMLLEENLIQFYKPSYMLRKIDTVVVEFINASLSHKDNDNAIINSLNFKLTKGDHMAILGPNGIGKSSIAKLLAGKLDPSTWAIEGDILLFGRSIYAEERSEKITSLISTETHINATKKFSGYRTVEDALKEKCESCLLNVFAKVFRVQDILKLPFSQLSQGQQKLVLIVEALITQPHILILDEISHGLDHINRNRVFQILNAVGKLTHTNIIMITHHEEEILKCVSRVVVLENGQFRKENSV